MKQPVGERYLSRRKLERLCEEKFGKGKYDICVHHPLWRFLHITLMSLQYDDISNIWTLDVPYELTEVRRNQRMLSWSLTRVARQEELEQCETG
jgi:hypothetical protein